MAKKDLVPPPEPAVDLESLIPTPRVEVLERGLANVFGLPSAPIRLKRPEMVTHWCNTAISGHQLTKYLEAGYLKVRPEMLESPDQVPHSVSPDGYVTQGVRHEIILLYTLASHAKDRQRQKVKKNLESMNPHVAKRDVVEAASQHLGDEAASYLDKRGGPIGQVTDTREIRQRLPEGGE